MKKLSGNFLFNFFFFYLRWKHSSITDCSSREHGKLAKLCTTAHGKRLNWKSTKNIIKYINWDKKYYQKKSHLFSLPSSGISRALVWYLQLILRQAPKRRRIFRSNRMTGQSLGSEQRTTGNAAVFQDSVHLTPTQAGVLIPAQNTTQFLLAPRHQLQTRTHAHPQVYEQYTDSWTTICSRSTHNITYKNNPVTCTDTKTCTFRMPPAE